jgi:hypothetical protein
MILPILVLAGAAPHFIPKMDRESAIVKQAADAGLQHVSPIQVIHRAENVMPFLVFLKRKFLDHFGHQSGAGFSPNETGRVLCLTNFAGIFHRCASRRRLYYRAGDAFAAALVYLTRKNVLVSEIKRLQTNRIAINPPTASGQEQRVTEKVGKTGITSPPRVLKDV